MLEFLHITVIFANYFLEEKEDFKIDPEYLLNLRNVCNCTHPFIKKDLLKFTMKQDAALDKKSEFVYDVLRKSLDFLSVKGFNPFYKLVLESYDAKCSSKLTTAKSIVFTNFINRIVKFSDQSSKKNLFGSQKYDVILDEYIKIIGLDNFNHDFIVSAKELMKRKMGFCNSVPQYTCYDTILLFEMIYMTIIYDYQFLITNKIPDIEFENTVILKGMIEQLKKYKSNEIFIYFIKNGEHYTTVDMLYLEAFIFIHRKKLNKAQICRVDEKPNSIVPKDLNFLKGKDLHLKHYQYDIIYGLLQLYAEVREKYILVRVACDFENKITIKLISVEDTPFSSSVLDYYEYTKNFTDEASKEIEENIKNGKFHHFDDFINLERYSFAKTSEDVVGEKIKCLKLDCGHYLGYDMINSFLRLKFKCQLCRKRVKIDKFFTHMVYKTEGNDD